MNELEKTEKVRQEVRDKYVRGSLHNRRELLNEMQDIYNSNGFQRKVKTSDLELMGIRWKATTAKDREGKTINLVKILT